MIRFAALALVGSLVTSVSAAEVDYPIAVAAASDGTIYVADRYLPGVWRVKDGKTELYFQGSKKFRTPLNAVRCLAIDRSGKLLAGDSATRQIYRFDDSAQPVPLVKGVGIGVPMGLAVAKDGMIYTADLETQRIWKIAAEGGDPAEVVEIPGIRSLTIDTDDRLWAVTNTARAVIRLVDGKQEVVLNERVFSYPQHLLLDKAGNVLVSDSYSKAVWKVTPEGKAEKAITGGDLQYPVGLAWNGETLLITDSKARTVFAWSDGKLTRVLAEPAKK